MGVAATQDKRSAVLGWSPRILNPEGVLQGRLAHRGSIRFHRSRWFRICKTPSGFWDGSRVPRTALRLSWASKCSPFGAKNPLIEGVISSPLAATQDGASLVLGFEMQPLRGKESADRRHHFITVGRPHSFCVIGAMQTSSAFAIPKLAKRGPVRQGSEAFTPKGFDLKAQGKRSAALGRAPPWVDRHANSEP